ncbi:MAG TPA: DUF4188 domain-containing protein [Acidimicrobiales bacterium]|jgi:hypothetical protein|nr:DUF4188 domain-containing protein [Acidimicrobiales bacterium]
MAKVQAGRYTADHDGEIVVFLIGMRVNRIWKVKKWLPTAAAMGPMLRELAAHPEKGLLGAEPFLGGRTIMLVTYWRSFDDLERFARNPDDPHLPAWRAFNRRVGTSGDVGVFHETFVVPTQSSESIYANMPVFGLAKATASVPIGRKGQAARFRIGSAKLDEPAEPVPV